MENESARTKYRWVICGLLFLATTINYIDRQILSLLKPLLDTQLGWTSTQFGAINSAFQGAYAGSLFFFGWFIDKYGTKLGYALSIGLWSLAALAHALVHSLTGFAGARIALGIGEGGNFPAAVKATAQWFPIEERAFATSLFNSGANVGAVLAPAFVPVIAYSLGWHWAFIFAGGAGFLWLALWLPLFREPAQARRVSVAELVNGSTGPGADVASGEISRGDVLRHRQAWSYICAKFLADPIWWFFLIWLPDFFHKTRHLDIRSSGPLLVGIYSIVTVLSIFGGWVTGWLTSRGWSVTRARKAGLLVPALCVLPIACVTHVGILTAVLLIGLAGGAHQAWSANLYTTVSDMFPPRAVATLTGIGSAAGAFGGMIFPLLTGLVLDHYANGYAVIFGYCSVAYLLAFAVNHLLAPNFEPVLLRT